MQILRKFLNSLLSKIGKFPFLPKGMVFIIDILIVILSFSLSYFICYSFIPNPIYIKVFLIKVAFLIGVTGLSFYAFETYSDIIRYSGFRDILRIFVALLVANIVLYLTEELTHIGSNHLIIFIGFFLNLIFSFSFIVLFRMFIRFIFDYAKTSGLSSRKTIPVFIYGINDANIDIVRLMDHSQKLKYKPQGFISPKPTNAHKRVLNLPVHYVQDIFTKKNLLNRFRGIVINPREIDRQEKQWLAEQCLKYKKELLSTPPLEDWTGQPTIKTLNKVKIEDLLQRIPIQIDIESIGKNLEGKTILITGAAGSIGSELVRQICKFKVGKLLLCDVAESPLHEIGLEVKDKCPYVNSIPLIADVRKYDQMEALFEEFRPNIVYHAAAYKHVPLMEQYPCESILTNVLGSKNVADLAVKYNAEAFVMISTDKAVNPSNVMGASKRLAEIYIQSLFQDLKKRNPEKSTRIITTRFGNVLGSNGSVIPRFEQQIAKGGPVTVTHPDIIRYFMTIPEACRLVLDAGNFGQGGEVFVFDMGESVKIKDMAEEIIRLSGLTPYEDIDIVYTGLRPGEKLYEELLYDKEKVKPTHNPKIMIGAVKEYDYEKIKNDINKLISTADSRNKMDTVRLMKEIVPEFVSQNSEYCKFDEKDSSEK